MPPILTPTPVGGGGGDGLTEPEVEAIVDASIAALVDSSPAALDTLNELAAALGDDANFATTVTTALAGKVDKSDGGREVVQSHGSTGAAETIDLANGNVHTAAQDQSCTYTFTAPTNSVACSFTLILTSVTGTATWPASVNWPDGAAPTLTGRCVLTFVTVDGGTNWDGFLAGSELA